MPTKTTPPAEPTTRTYTHYENGVHRAHLTETPDGAAITWHPQGQKTPTTKKYATVKAAEKDGWAEAYNVCSTVTGAEVVICVPLELAQSERARLNAEARTPNPERTSSRWPQGEPWGLHAGVVTSYEVVSANGIVVA